MYIGYICIYVHKVFPTGGWEKYPPPNRNFIILFLRTKFLFLPHQKPIQSNKKIKTSFLAVVIAPVPFFVLNFILFWNTGHDILILTDVQYSQNTAFSFEKFSNRQNYSFSGSLDLVKKSPQQCILLFNTKSGKLVLFSSIQYFGNLGVNLSS